MDMLSDPADCKPMPNDNHMLSQQLELGFEANDSPMNLLSSPSPQRTADV